MNKYQRKLINIKEYFDTKSLFTQEKVKIPVVLFIGIFLYSSFAFPLAATQPILYWACIVLGAIPFLSFVSFYILINVLLKNSVHHLFCFSNSFRQFNRKKRHKICLRFSEFFRALNGRLLRWAAAKASSTKVFLEYPSVYFQSLGEWR